MITGSARNPAKLPGKRAEPLITFGQRGGIRSAPSIRIVSPLR
jgi:hypothetical protein